MARSWLITGRGIAKKIRYTAPSANHKISELIAEARRECPNCSHVIDNSDVAMLWPGLPAGVKFDPSDSELLEHLEEKIGLGGSKPHVLIDEFIPTIDNDEGICYSHPENLPGIKTDGSNAHFFHRLSKAYNCGKRKRRRIISCGDNTVTDDHVRWHKTGRSKPIYDNGVKKGWKEIMVLYKSSQRGGKPDRAHWVMHQYHLGEEEDEKDGDLVVSRIFYQMPNKSTEVSETETAYDEPDASASVIGPKTPKTNIPQPRHPDNSPCETEQNASILQDPLLLQDEGEPTISIVSLEDDAVNPAWCAGAEEQQAVGGASRAQLNLDEPLLCREDPNSLNDEALLPLDSPILSQCRNEILDRNLNTFFGLPDLHNVDLGTPPDLQLGDLQFGSQESLGSWLDRI
ncbi:NAC domain-containing protein 73-like [Panicum miliaceum]|uniref:NAC domain-containing protein 73-like n=1 Tax=Panicum miliaceum TaxID=4540 RepID=A0A3L6RMF1_PANMI|nr:NAC domain-containing protein 73-like [Panicum miliaceum]